MRICADQGVVSRHEAKDIPGAIAAYTEAIRLDPNYALAFAGRSFTLTAYARRAATGAAVREGFEKAEVDARQAIALAPDLAEAHIALAYVLQTGTLDFARRSEEYERALALAPGNAQVLRFSGLFAAYMGHFDAGIAAARRALVLDPLYHASHFVLGRALYAARRYHRGGSGLRRCHQPQSRLQVQPMGSAASPSTGLGISSARAPHARRTEMTGSVSGAWRLCTKARTAPRRGSRIRKMKARMGDAGAYQYATIYAQWGDRPKALDWLDTAMRLRDPGLENLKTDPLFDPLRHEPRFQAVERELNFPTE